jgi:hypothetical protein
MPVQTQTSSVAQKFGARIAAANAEHKDKPLDLGFKRLPPGIRDGVGKLHTVQLKQYGQDEKIVALRGQEYLQVIGVVKYPKVFNNETTEGHQMFLRYPLCDIPANPNNSYSKAKSFSDNFYDFQQFFMRFGFNPPNETTQTDPQGTKTWAFYLGAIQALAAKVVGNDGPHYDFTTRSWFTKPTVQAPKGEERIEEEWGKQCEWNGRVDPAAGVDVQPPFNPATQPEPFTEPPTGQVMVGNLSANNQTFTDAGVAHQDPADIVAALVECAMNDPEGATADGANAAQSLEEAAWLAGWTKDDTKNAENWAAVGAMVLTTPQTAPTAAPAAATTTLQATEQSSMSWTGNIVPGTKCKFAKRTKDGAKLCDAGGKPFPPQEVEVVTVNLTNKTCTVKTKDGKAVVDIRTKSPIDVKFEWLE